MSAAGSSSALRTARLKVRAEYARLQGKLAEAERWLATQSRLCVLYEGRVGDAEERLRQATAGGVSLALDQIADIASFLQEQRALAEHEGRRREAMEKAVEPLRDLVAGLRRRDRKLEEKYAERINSERHDDEAVRERMAVEEFISFGRSGDH